MRRRGKACSGRVRTGERAGGVEGDPSAAGVGLQQLPQGDGSAVPHMPAAIEQVHE